jgi:hypothetical protein
MLKHLILILLITACSSASKNKVDEASTASPNVTTKEFSRGELILGTQLLTKIFDGEMAPLECVPDTDEAGLLLRTIRPRMEVVQDDMEALLDDPKEVDNLIKTCQQNCTCASVDELLREHLVALTKNQQKLLNAKKTEKETNRCLSFVQTTFCQSELFKTLDQEKADFTYEVTP